MKLDSDGNGAFVSLWSILLFGFLELDFFFPARLKKNGGKGPTGPPNKDAATQTMGNNADDDNTATDVDAVTKTTR